ncbi:MAG: T9SS type A sorting domain-containing protein [Bacteroidetes bacterium]|nr:T9SS type A sorting domain-containing protein [Bacteroidota bacterium]MCL1968810.1 T9SS type A sorting domain-containing protein [Bacteroidota bacterium]
MKKHDLFLKLLFLFLAIHCFTNTFAQVSFGGIPPSFSFETENEILSTTENLPIIFDVAAMRAEDAERKLDNLPPRVGKTIPVNFTTDNSGEWTLLPNGQDIWRLCIIAEDAIAIMLTYDKFEIPAGGKLFIYNDDRSQVLGAYTEETNPKRVEFATEFVVGDIITLEYVAPPSTNYESPIIITGVVYGYNNLYSGKSHDGSKSGVSFLSDPCEVNINCPEGDNWQDQKRGVARIIIPAGGGYVYYCSGSLVNNTSNNFDPLFLSAYHCYDGATQQQVNQSVYYFHYEYLACNGGGSATQRTTTGATILVNIPMNGASDGTLLRLNNAIPSNWSVYYNGWDRRNIPATSGVSIHHPDGDRKKISTFTSQLVSAGSINFGSGVVTAPNSAWRVTWAPTVTNHGVTEGGSSGSPIFNQNGRIVGTLSGGSSFCTTPYQPDFYGKLWYHWDQHPTLQMKTYLDPTNSGVEFIDGIYAEAPCNPPTNLTVTYTIDCKAVLTWDAPAGTGLTYKIFRDNTQIASDITATTYTDTTYNHAKGHTWAVATVCSSGGESNKISYNLPNGCTAVYTVSVSANPPVGGTVSGGGDYDENTSVTVTAEPAEHYKFINWTKNGTEISTESVYTFPVTANVELVANFIDNTGIDENKLTEYFTLHPNPAGNLLNVMRTDAGNAQIVIYNNIGLIVLSKEISNKDTQINISTLSSGIYFIRVTDSRNSATKCFMKE